MRTFLLVALVAIFAVGVLAAIAQGTGTGSLASGTGIYRQIPFSSITASNATGTLTLASDGTFTITSGGLVSFVVASAGTWTVQAGGSNPQAQLVLRSVSTGSVIQSWTYNAISGNFATPGSFSLTLAADSYYFAFGSSTLLELLHEADASNVELINLVKLLREANVSNTELLNKISELSHSAKFGRTSTVTNFSVTIRKTI